MTLTESLCYNSVIIIFVSESFFPSFSVRAALLALVFYIVVLSPHVLTPTTAGPLPRVPLDALDTTAPASEHERRRFVYPCSGRHQADVVDVPSFDVEQAETDPRHRFDLTLTFRSLSAAAKRLKRRVRELKSLYVSIRVFNVVFQ